jgi:predicted secreted Zn-dependent protease
MKWIFIVCVLMSGILYGQKIYWQEGLKLTWDNFKSKANNQRGTNVVAYTNCGWSYSYVKSSNPKAPIKIKVETIFNENQSWKDVKRINNYVLLHEQKHFDAAEVFARKLRKEISEKIKTSSDFDRYFKSIYSRILRDYQDFQKHYDAETKNGMVEEKQADYNRIIAEELENYKSYRTS